MQFNLAIPSLKISAIVIVAACAFLWLTIQALKMKFILEVESGMSRHYVVKHGTPDGKREILFFPFRHLDFGQVLFLVI